MEHTRERKREKKKGKEERKEEEGAPASPPAQKDFILCLWGTREKKGRGRKREFPVTPNAS